MKFSAKVSGIDRKQGACCVIGMHQSTEPAGLAERFDRLTGGALGKRISAGDFTGERNQLMVIYDPPGLQCQRLIVVGYGDVEKLTATRYRAVCATVARKLKQMNVRTATMWMLADKVEGCDVAMKARHLVEAMQETDYRYSQKSTSVQNPGLSITLALTGKAQLDKARAGVVDGSAIAAGVRMARELGDLPGNICTPSYLARQARRLEKTHPIKTRVLSEAEMKKLGMGSLLSVSRGSRQPAKLIIMEYNGAKSSSAPVALVGKGLTFDAGGISIKPAAKMDEMKYDMCGAASVFGALVAAAEMGLKLNVVGVIPSSENLPDGDANKPGDVVTSMSGKTIEILNTDAEGRLILCDALTYTKRYKPATVIDIATLTGACIVALGHHASGLMSNDDELAGDLVKAGEISGDRVWRLPLWDDYQKQLDSNFADMANIGGPAGGTITAGCFLSRFTEEFSWAHLDIAGTAWRSGGTNKGSTGRVVPLLSQFLIDRAG